MHTRYFTPSAQWIVQQLWPETLRFAKIEYLYPFKLRLSGVQIASEPTIELQQMDLWLNPYGLLEQQLEIDSVLIDGANLAHGLPNLPCRNLSISTNWRCTILTGLTKGLSRVASAYRSSSQFGTHPNSSYRTENSARGRPNHYRW